MRLILVSTVLFVGLGVASCKRPVDKEVSDPSLQGQQVGMGGMGGHMEMGGAAAAAGEALHPDEVPHANVGGATGDAVKGAGAAAAVDDATPMTAEESAAYHKVCHNALKRMAACAKDPGFLKYQSRWTSKGAPKAGGPSFEKRIVSWGNEGERVTSCKAWSTRPGTRSHFATTSKLATLTEDAKLSCEMFGQELDDDGWFPAALTDL